MTDSMIPVHVKGKNMELSDTLRRHIEEKVGKLDRYLDDISGADVEVAHELTRAHGDRHVVQVTINAHGAILRGEEKAGDVRVAVDAVVDVLHRQIERYKSKLYRKPKGHKTIKTDVKVIETTPTGAITAEDAEVVRQKRVPVKPMFQDEAVEQMELLGHDFFVFFNAENEQLNVLYRRQHGGYGLLVPYME